MLMAQPYGGSLMKMAIVQQRLGQRIRAQRLAKSLTQKGLAEAAGLNTNDVGEIERGTRNISLRVLYQLAEVLEVSPASLIADP